MTAVVKPRCRVAFVVAPAAVLVLAASPHPGGFCRLERARLAQAPREIALRGLAAVLGFVGGADHRPRLERLERLLDGLLAQAAAGTVARTLRGCPGGARGAGVRVAPGPAAIAAPHRL